MTLAILFVVALASGHHAYAQRSAAAGPAATPTVAAASTFAVQQLQPHKACEGPAAGVQHDTAACPEGFSCQPKGNSHWRCIPGNPQSLRHLVQTTAAETPTRATSQELPIAAETPGAATAPTAGNGTTAGSTAPRATSSGGPNTTAANTTAASESATSSSEAQIAAGNDTLLAPLNETGTLTSANRTSAGGAAGGGAGVDGNGTFQGTAALPGANRSSASQASSSYAVPLADCPAGQTAIASECVSNSQAPGATSNGVIGAVQQQGSAAAGLKPANDAGVQQWVVALLLMVFMAAVAPV